MNTEYVLNDDIDLTFDDIDISDDEKLIEITTNLRPTDAMQAQFLRNCVEEGILSVN